MNLYYVKFDKNPSKSSVESIFGEPVSNVHKIYKNDELDVMDENYVHYFVDKIKCYKTKFQAENVLDDFLIENQIIINKSGKITLYHLNGVKDKVYFHNNGKKEGDEINYTEANTIFSIRKYINGNEINNTVYYDYANNIISCVGEYQNNKYIETEYNEYKEYKDKTIASISTYNKEKKIEKIMFFDLNNNLTRVIQSYKDYELEFDNRKKIYYLKYKSELVDESDSYILLLRNNILLFLNFSMVE